MPDWIVFSQRFLNIMMCHSKVMRTGSQTSELVKSLKQEAAFKGW